MEIEKSTTNRCRLVERIYRSFNIWCSSQSQSFPLLQFDDDTEMVMDKSLNEIARRSLSLTYALDELNKNSPEASFRADDQHRDKEVLFSNAHEVFFHELERFIRNRLCGINLIAPGGIHAAPAAAALLKKEIFMEIHVFHLGISWRDTKVAAGRTLQVVKRMKIENIQVSKVTIKVYLYVSYVYNDSRKKAEFAKVNHSHNNFNS